MPVFEVKTGCSRSAVSLGTQTQDYEIFRLGKTTPKVGFVLSQTKVGQN